MTCLSFLEILDNKAKSHDVIVMGKYTFCVDKHGRVRRAFKETEDKTKFEEIDMKTMVTVIVEFLSDKIHLEKFIKAKVLQYDPKTIIDLYERVQNKPKIIEKPRCYTIEIAGKKGYPLELNF